MDTKVFLMRLIISCPLKNAHTDCPFNELRNAPITELIEITNRLKNDEIKRMNKQHKKCLRDRTKMLKAS